MTTHLTLKSLLIVSSLAGAFVLGACGKELAVKVYKSKVELGGFYREQDKELILYKDTDGFYCTDEAGMRKLVQAYKVCKELGEGNE